MRRRTGDLKSDGGEKVSTSVATKAGSREKEARRKLTAFVTYLCHGLCDSGLASTCRAVKPEELLRGSSLDPRIDSPQYFRAGPRMTSGGREPFLRVISGTRGDPLRERLQGGGYHK